jgi:hypothetical protein
MERPVILFFQSEVVEPPFCWIIELGQGKVQLGSQECDGWAIKLNDRIISIQEKKDCTFILPILECNRKSFFDSLQKYPTAFKRKDSFPEALLLSNAFSYPGSDYWASKAISWIGDDWEEIPQLEEILMSATIGKNWSQRVRHDFRKLQKKLSKSL